MKQTAVEWLFEKLWNTDKDKFTWYAILKQAKEMEKEQILRAYDIGSNEGYDLAKIDEIEEGHYMKEPIEYYNETFKSEQQSVTDDTL
jgi:hypothetical protein